MQRFLIAALVLGGCATVFDDSQTDEQSVGRTEYLDILDFTPDQDAWLGIRNELRQEFDDVCGDTFCEGEYANLTSLRFTCSVTSKLGKVKDCVWTFAASQAEVDASTAAIAIDAPTFQCHIRPATTAKKLIALLAGKTDAIHIPLPGTTSIYDALGECFEHPIGQTPIEISGEGSTYVSADAYYTSTYYYFKWRDAQAALVAGFDRVCGDTFCGGDYGDLRSLDFVCSVTKSTGNVKSCAWVFGGSYALPGPTLDVTSDTFRCAVPVKGTLSQLISTLTRDESADPINRPLPGTTSTAYDALLGCLP